MKAYDALISLFLKCAVLGVSEKLVSGLSIDFHYFLLQAFICPQIHLLNSYYSLVSDWYTTCTCTILFASMYVMSPHLAYVIYFHLFCLLCILISKGNSGLSRLSWTSFIALCCIGSVYVNFCRQFTNFHLLQASPFHTPPKKRKKEKKKQKENKHILL